MAQVIQMTQETPLPDEQISFDDFWLVYPRREAKKDAKKAWGRLTPNQQMEALTALVDWRRVFMARESERFIPLAASWLNGERWEDELPADFRAVAGRQKENEEFKQRYSGERAPMPDKLRSLLATLKK